MTTELKWKIDSNDTHKVTIGELNITIHRWVHEKDKWFLSIRNGPLFFDRYPLSELDIEGAKKEAINMLVQKADEVQNALHVAAKRDSKKIQSFKLRLVAILNEAENLQNKYYNRESNHGANIESLIATIRTAMSDL
jgi:hypothetical protein